MGRRMVTLWEINAVRRDGAYRAVFVDPGEARRTYEDWFESSMYDGVVYVRKWMAEVGDPGHVAAIVGDRTDPPGPCQLPDEIARLEDDLDAAEQIGNRIEAVIRFFDDNDDD